MAIFPEYKSMGIFSDVQGQLTPQSVVQSVQNSNSSEPSYMSLLPASMDEKQPRKSGDTVFLIITLSVTIETSGRIWPNVKLIQALMYVIITCKHEKDLIMNSGEQVAQRVTIAHLTAIHQNIFNSSQVKDFLNWSRAANSAVHG